MTKRKIETATSTANLDASTVLDMQSLSPKMKLMYGKDEKEYRRVIGEMKQEYKDNGNRTKIDSTGELFNKYLQLSTSLSDSAQEWSLQLCLAYLSALMPELAKHMTTTNALHMPPLTALTTKAKQLDALRFIRRYDVVSYKYLEDERDRMTKLLKQMNRTRPRVQTYTTHVEEDMPQNSGHVYQHGLSQAESNIECYKGTPPPPPSCIPVQAYVETKFDPNTGLQHPFDRASFPSVSEVVAMHVVMMIIDQAI